MIEGGPCLISLAVRKPYEITKDSADTRSGTPDAPAQPARRLRINANNGGDAVACAGHLAFA